MAWWVVREVRQRDRENKLTNKLAMATGKTVTVSGLGISVKVQSESYGRLSSVMFPDGDKQEASYGVKEGLFYSLASSQVHVTYTRYHRSVHN